METLHRDPPSTASASVDISPPGSEMITLSLDLGTYTGWVLHVGDEITSGTLVLASKEDLRQQLRSGAERRLDVRFRRFIDFLRSHVASGVNRIVFEDVLFKSKINYQATQLWTSLRTAIWVVAHDNPAVQVYPVPVGTLKCFACGPGRGAGRNTATKEDMAKALAMAEPGRFTMDEKFQVRCRSTGREIDNNEIDAIWVSRYTRAVDRGEQEFLAHFERLEREKAEKKARAKLKKEARKAKLLLKKEKAILVSPP